MTPPPETDEPIQQACAIPFRRNGARIELCLITSLHRKRWIFPKGIIDPGETPAETALKEAREEAGLAGRIVGPPLGRYVYHKWGTTLEVTTLLMQVDRCDASWDEADVRQRRWVAPAEAIAMLDQDELVELTKRAVQCIEQDNTSRH